MFSYQKPFSAKFAVAPMLDWTDRHCRFFHRLLSKKALLYTEMVVADAIIHGKRDQLLSYNKEEHPIALQVGGSDPDKLAEACRVVEEYGFNEINLNVGCPSDRVQSGSFGACLMLEPETVARSVEAMKKAVNLPITVKCRIGVDEQDVEQSLDKLGYLVFSAGCDAMWVHARKAWLKGLSPKENRDIPPLDYERVYRFKIQYPDRFIGINGGVQSIEETLHHLNHCDGVMVGRCAYHEPAILSKVDAAIYGLGAQTLDHETIIETMCDYADRHIETGGRLSHITRHMIGLFHGAPGARRWRQILSSEANKYDATSRILKQAYREVLLSSS